MSENQEPQKSNTKGILIGLAAVLAGVGGVEGYFLNKKEGTIALQKDTISTVQNKNKELLEKIEATQNQLDEQIKRGDLLQSEKDSLIKLNEQLEADKKALRSQLAYVPAMKAKYEAKLKEAELKLSELGAKSDQNDSISKAQFAEIQTLKADKAKLLDSILKISAVKDELDNKVKLAQILKADNFHITVLKKSGKEKEDDGMEYKAKNIDKIKVSFNILENKVAVVETKEFYLRVLGPDGAVIYNENTGGGSVEVAGEQVYYTSKQDMLYDGKKQTMTFLYHNQNEWKKGKQKIEVFSEGQKIGEGSFVVK